MGEALDPLADLRRRRDTDLALELERELARRAVAPHRIDLETTKNDGVDVGREVGRELAGPREVALDHAHDDVDLFEPVVEAAPDEELPEDDRCCEHVGATVDLATDLLRGHVRELALDLAFTRHLRAPCSFRDAEVEHARRAVSADDDVLR